MRWWMMATMLAACAGTGGSDGTDGTDDPGPLPDPWADDLLLGPISDLGDLRVTGIRWSGWSAEGDVLAVVELRDGLRPVGQSLVTVGDEVEVLLDSAALQAEVGQNGLLDVRTDASGAISFETAGGCWMWFQDGALDGHCETDVYVDFRGPQLAGVQPVLVQQQDRLTYEVGLWDGTWNPYRRSSSRTDAVSEWAVSTDQGLWLITADSHDRVDLQRLTPEGELIRRARLQDLPLFAASAQFTARMRGLTVSPVTGQPYVVLSGRDGPEMTAGTGIHALDDDGLELRVDLTQPIVDGQLLAFLGTGAEPALTWAFDRDERIVFTGELADGRTGIYDEDGAGSFTERVRSGDPVTDRYGEVISGQTWARIATGILGPDGEVVFTAKVDGAPEGEDLGAWLALPDGSTFELARLGADLPDSTENVERMLLHGGAVVFPDPTLSDPLLREGAPVTGEVNEQTLISWGAAGWNRSIWTEGSCTSVVFVLGGEEDEALVRRQAGSGC